MINNLMILIKKYFIVGLFPLIIIACSTNKEKISVAETTPNKYRVIAYVVGYQDNWGTNFEKAKQITHINYAFANIKEGKVVLGDIKNVSDLVKTKCFKKSKSRS